MNKIYGIISISSNGLENFWEHFNHFFTDPSDTINHIKKVGGPETLFTRWVVCFTVGECETTVFREDYAETHTFTLKSPFILEE